MSIASAARQGALDVEPRRRPLILFLAGSVLVGVLLHASPLAAEPPRSDCSEHLKRCLASKLADAPGNVYGTKRCPTCYDICRGSGSWPDKTGDGKTCRYW